MQRYASLDSQTRTQQQQQQQQQHRQRQRAAAMAAAPPAAAWDAALILGDPFFLATVSIAVIGWLVAFVASVAASSASSAFPHFAWWTVVYELCVLAGVVAVVAARCVDRYRLAILAYLAAAFAFATSVTNVLIYSALAAEEAAAAGHIFVSIVCVVWIFHFGSSPHDPPPRTRIDSYSLARPEMNLVGPPRPATRDGSCRHNTSLSPTYNSQKPYRAPSPLPAEPADLVQPTEYPHRARAIYAYEANPEDPNEVSFAKGEVLDVSDVAGKWWQVRKHDGATGIAPSNYLALLQ